MPAWLVSLLPGALGRIFDFADGWSDRRKQVIEAKHDATMARIKDMSGSWKDEYVLVITSYPLVSLFIPPLRESTIQSIEYLNSLPAWMVGTWVGIVAAVYGFQKIPKVKK
jgi:negative regulator of sigma E activity